MRILRVSLVLLVFLSSIIFCFRHGNTPYLRFTSARCTSSNQSNSGFKCFVKSHSRRNTTLNVLVNLTRDVYDARMRFDLRYKALSNSFRSIINVSIEACSFLNGTNYNPVFQWITGLLGESFKNSLHPCPYKKGLVKFTELYSNPGQHISNFPAGNYMGIIKLWDSKDENLITIKYNEEFHTSDKEDF